MSKIAEINEYINEQKYKEVLPLLESFCDETAKQIIKLLESANVTLGFPVQYRVKTWESISTKLERLSRFNDLKEIQDLVGLRIILLFKRDIDEVIRLIQENFTIMRQYNTQERLKEDQFGYSSVHLIVRLKREWLPVPTFAGMSELVAEIQVRTLTQHIWAEASHKLQYKQEMNIPPIVRRSIYRVSALLETVDLEFERVLEEREAYRSQVIDRSRTTQEEKLNVDLLGALLDAQLPAANKSPNEDYATLLANLQHFGIESKQQLTHLLEKHLSQVLEVDTAKVQELIEASRSSDSQRLPQYTLSRVRKKVYLSHMGLVRQALRFEFGDKAGEYFGSGQSNRD